MMVSEVWTAIVSIPEGVLKATGVIVGGAFTGAFYLWGRLSKLPAPADAGPPRASLSETDRELGFTLIRTGTDLTRALHDHGEILRGFGGGSTPPAAPPTRRNPRT